MTTDVDQRRLAELNAAATEFFATHLCGHRPAVRYLHRRGVLAAAVAARPWLVGYASARVGALREHLTGLGFTEPDLVAAGLLTHTRHGVPVEVFRDRVMFPIRALDGPVLGFTGRLLGRVRPGATRIPRYRNTATTALYHKGATLFGLAEQLGPAHRAGPVGAVVLVEGPTDALALVRAGRHLSTVEEWPGGRWVVVAPCGTTLSTAQLRLLSGAVPAGTPLVVAFDADRAGRAATARARDLLAGWPGPVCAARPGDGLDPAGLVARAGPRAAAGQLLRASQPLVDLIVADRLAAAAGAAHPREIEARLGTLRALAPLAAQVADRDPGHAAELALRLTVALDLAPGTVLDAVQAAGRPRTGARQPA